MKESNGFSEVAIFLITRDWIQLFLKLFVGVLFQRFLAIPQCNYFCFEFKDEGSGGYEIRKISFLVRYVVYGNE